MLGLTVLHQIILKYALHEDIPREGGPILVTLTAGMNMKYYMQAINGMSVRTI